MTDEALLTLRQLARELSLPESTLRYYRDAFLDHIPSVGTGRRRRYPREAVAVLRSIARAYASGESRSAIIQSLDRHAPQAAMAVPARKSAEPRALEEVSNLDLLAAIVDGEREQRDALWQMAKEIVRLTEVLEGQETVLSEIADRAGVVVGGRLAPARSAGPAIAAPAQSVVATPGAVASAAVPAAMTPEPPVPPPPPQPPPAPAPTPAPPPVVEEAGPEFPAWSAPPPAPAPPPPVPVGEPSVLGDNPFAPEPPPPAAAPSQAPAEAAAGAAPPPGGEIERLRRELEAERALVDRLREAKLKLEHRAADAEAELEQKRASRRQSVIKRILGSSGE